MGDGGVGQSADDVNLMRSGVTYMNCRIGLLECRPQLPTERPRRTFDGMGG